MLALHSLLLAGCAHHPATGMDTPANAVAGTADSGIALLQSGDLAVRMGRDITSYMISRLNEQYSSYSHCGLVQVENGYPWVYHCVDNGQGAGGIRRDSASRFFSPAQCRAAGIWRYALTPDEQAAMRREIARYYRRSVSYDTGFDLETDEQVYCTELVYKVMNIVKHDNAYIPTARRRGVVYVPVDNLYRDGRASPVWQKAFK